MRLNWQSWLLLTLSALLICSSAIPLHAKDESNEGIAEAHQMVARSPFTLFGVDLMPRVPKGLGGFKLPKPAPKPAPKPKPSTEPSKPAASQPAPTSQKPTSQSSKISSSSSLSSSSVPSSVSSTASSSGISSQSSGTISASSQSTGSISSSGSSSSGASSTTSGEQVQTTRDPQDVGKCNKNGCSGSTCKIAAPKGTTPKTPTTPKKIGAREIHAGINVLPRVFLPVNDNGNLAQFPTNAQNQDLSDPDSAESTFMEFDAKLQQTIRVSGLAGCTVVAAVSPKGMIATHLFEHGDKVVGKGKNQKIQPDIANTLHPNAFQATLARAETFLSAHRDQLAGGRLVVMMPVNKDGGQKKGQFRYDTETWPAIGKRDPNTFTTGRVKGTGIRAAIEAMAERATGLQAEIARYEVATRDGNEPPEEAIDGTFVMQYDPNNAPGTAEAAAAQAFIEGKEFFNPVFQFAPPGAAAAPAPDAAT